MWNTFKPVVVPTLILAAEYVAMNQGLLANDLLIGVVFGVTLAWALAAYLSAGGNLVRRFPWLREWAPFLDPTGKYASDAELKATYIRGKTFRLADVAEGGRVSGRTFEDCVILGPAVLATAGSTYMVNHSIKARCLGGVVWPLDPAPEKPGQFYNRDGAVVCEDCRFIKCTFDGVGFAQPKEHFLKSLTAIHGDPPPQVLGIPSSPTPQVAS